MTLETIPSHARRARTVSWAIRFIVFGGVGLWLYRDDTDLAGIVFQSPGYILSAWALGIVAMGLAALRWQYLMLAFGARQPPPTGHLWQLNLIGHFYNVFVPGAVGGDIGRGYIARKVFDAPTTSYFVIAGERIIGLATLGLVFGIGLWIGPRIPAIAHAEIWVIIPMGLGIAVFGLALLGRRIRQWWTSAPELTAPKYVVWAVGLSLVTHSLTIIAFTLLSVGCALGPTHSGLDISLMVLVVPIALIAQVLPVAIAGIGPREVALVFLLPSVAAVTDSGAMALSLSYAAANILLALSGGLLQVLSGSTLVTGLGFETDLETEKDICQ